MKSRIIKFSICHTEAIRKLPQSDVLTSYFFNGCIIKPFYPPFYEQFFAALKRYSIYIAIRIVRSLFLMIRVYNTRTRLTPFRVYSRKFVRFYYSLLMEILIRRV